MIYLDEKMVKLEQYLLKPGRVLVAFSGGVDSTFLLKAATIFLKDKVGAVTASSVIQIREEIEFCKKFAGELNINHYILPVKELCNPNFANNPPQRCYYCKKEIFSAFISLAKKYGYDYVLDGSNADDQDDFRPGSKALEELDIKSPLKEIGFTKQEIRILSEKFKLPTWNKPSSACLASRIPYGEKITEEKINQVYQAEKWLKSNGFQEVRVRYHNNIARIELPTSQIADLTNEPLKTSLINKFKKIGFTYITVDLQGFRSGSMNETLFKEQKYFG